MARRRAPTSIRQARARKKGITQEASGINFLDDVFSRESVFKPKSKQTRGNL